MKQTKEQLLEAVMAELCQRHTLIGNGDPQMSWENKASWQPSSCQNLKRK